MIATKIQRVTPIPQDADSTCWLAAYQMMFKWKGKPVAMIPTLMQGAVPSVAMCYEKGLDKFEWDKTGKAFGLTTTAVSASFSAADLADYLRRGPVLVHAEFGLGMHSIVVIGCTVSDSIFDDSEMVTYINPFWQGTKEVFIRSSDFKTYLKAGLNKVKGIAGAIQYW